MTGPAAAWSAAATTSIDDAGTVTTVVTLTDTTTSIEGTVTITATADRILTVVADGLAWVDFRAWSTS